MYVIFQLYHNFPTDSSWAVAYIKFYSICVIDCKWVSYYNLFHVSEIMKVCKIFVGGQHLFVHRWSYNKLNWQWNGYDSDKISLIS